MILDLTKKEPPKFTVKDVLDLYHRVFDTTDGRMILEDLAHKSGFYTDVHPHLDHGSIMFIQGKRHLFLTICDNLQAEYPQDEPTNHNEKETIPWKK